MFAFLLGLILIGASVFLYFLWKNNQYELLKSKNHGITGSVLKPEKAMKKVPYLLAGFALSVCINNSYVFAETITWIHADFPPSTILSGPHMKKGLCDKMEQFLSKELPEYKYEEKVANFARIIKELEGQKTYLCASLVKNPERENFIQFSEISQISLPNGIVFLKSNYENFKPFLNKDGKIDLDKLIKNSNMKLGYAKGRSYTGIVDQLIKKYKEKENLYGRSGLDVFHGLLEMMLVNRVDYIIGYPQEARYFGELTLTTEKLSFLLVKGMPDYLPVYIGAPKNEWGKKIIAKIDKILLKKRHTPEVLAFYANWIDDNSVKIHKRIAREVFQK